MRKSILVIDTPECCNECEMCEEQTEIIAFVGFL